MKAQKQDGYTWILRWKVNGEGNYWGRITHPAREREEIAEDKERIKRSIGDPDITDLQCTRLDELMEFRLLPKAIEMDLDAYMRVRTSAFWWRGIANGYAVCNGRLTCSLCERFLVGEGNCEGCPIYQKTGQRGCQGTPYEELAELDPDDKTIGLVSEIEDDETRNEATRLAQNMKNFLFSLLPDKPPSA